MEKQVNSKKVWVEEVTERFCGHVIASTVRPTTDEDIRQAEELHKQGSCPHNCIVDEPGWLYDLRSCYTCGAGLGTV